MKILLPILFLFVQNNITRNRNQRWKKTGRQAANRKPNKKERMGWVH
jgi:hypothetical protein